MGMKKKKKLSSINICGLFQICIRKSNNLLILNLNKALEYEHVSLIFNSVATKNHLICCLIYVMFACA